MSDSLLGALVKYLIWEIVLFLVRLPLTVINYPFIVDLGCSVATFVGLTHSVVNPVLETGVSFHFASFIIINI